MEHALVAVDLETTGFDPASERIIEIGAARVRLGPGGSLEVGERFQTFVDPGRALPGVITRLTGIRDADLAGAPPPEAAVAAFAAFLAHGEGSPWLLGHNVGFDVAFLERAGLPGVGGRLDTADLASIILPEAPSYALQRLALDAGVVVDAAHRALDDALTCAQVLAWLAGRAGALPPAVLEEACGHA
ncbi:MAG: 3'-5' exonuclease, partial [Candidatus Limnocylindria bacterium]|nr:3'-5' exonuclease [Candidatus Limnocylindria bacterium]